MAVVLRDLCCGRGAEPDPVGLAAAARAFCRAQAGEDLARRFSSQVLCHLLVQLLEIRRQRVARWFAGFT